MISRTAIVWHGAELPPNTGNISQDGAVGTRPEDSNVISRTHSSAVVVSRVNYLASYGGMIPVRLTAMDSHLLPD